MVELSAVSWPAVEGVCVCGGGGGRTAGQARRPTWLPQAQNEDGRVRSGDPCGQTEESEL